MSDLAATNCGCGEERTNCGCGCETNCGCGCGNNSGGNNFPGFGNNSCSCILWIIILSCLCGNGGWGNNWNCGCGNNGGGCDSCWILIILLLLCGNNGCGC